MCGELSFFRPGKLRPWSYSSKRSNRVPEEHPIASSVRLFYNHMASYFGVSLPCLATVVNQPCHAKTTTQENELR